MWSYYICRTTVYCRQRQCVWIGQSHNAAKVQKLYIKAGLEIHEAEEIGTSLFHLEHMILWYLQGFTKIQIVSRYVYLLG